MPTRQQYMERAATDFQHMQGTVNVSGKISETEILLVVGLILVARLEALEDALEGISARMENHNP